MVYVDEWYGKPPPQCALPHHSHHNTFYTQMAYIKTDLKKNRMGRHALDFLALFKLL
jgi:hypothetical protein